MTIGLLRIADFCYTEEIDRAQLLKGILDLAVLSAIEDGERYGYALVEQLHAAGLRDVADASVYGTLKRLEVGRLLATRREPSSTGPSRKYYRLTDAGRHELGALREQWKAVTAAIDVLEGRHGPHT